MPTRPSILAVTSELPWPLDTGGHLRTFHVLRALASRFRVRLVAGVPRDAAAPTEALEAVGIAVRPVSLPRRTPLAEAGRVVAAAVANEPYVLYRRHDRPEMHAVVARELAADPPDVLYLDHLDAFLFAARRGRSRVVLDLHNVYARLVERTAESSGRDLARRLYLRREARLLHRVESRAVADTDLVFAVGEDERAHFSRARRIPAMLVPNGVDCAQYAALPLGRASTPATMLFLGTLNWAPNVDAARFLATTVLPAVRVTVPETTLHLVGRNPTAEVERLATLPGVTLSASVPDVLPALRDAALLAVPLDSGGGTRLKILEAFAAGLPVVSTAVGREGIDAVDGRDLIDAPREAFAEAVCGLLADPARGRELAASARALALRRYDWSVVGAVAVEAIERMLGGAA